MKLIIVILLVWNFWLTVGLCWLENNINVIVERKIEDIIDEKIDRGEVD